MKDLRDRFSDQSGAYKKFRPEYPEDFVEEIISLSSQRLNAWDCGTGNGQVAGILSRYFDKVDATDISDHQLQNAVQSPNINYQLGRAEKTVFAPNSFNLITVAQAVHWFDFNEFYKEVNRVSQDNGILALWGYGLGRIDPGIDGAIDRFYGEIVGEFWDTERKYVEQAYQNIPFPFQEIQLTKDYSIKKVFSPESLAGYIGTWSSVQKFISARGYNPVIELVEELKILWGNEKAPKTASFPLFTRIGKIIK